MGGYRNVYVCLQGGRGGVKNLRKTVYVVCVCPPGWCKTELARNVGLSLTKKILMAPFAFLFMRTSQEGAQNIIHAVLEEPSFFKVLRIYIIIPI